MSESGAVPIDVREEPGAALAGFIDKWRARWPEWAVVEVFVPAGQRELASAWAALLQELTDAAWGGTDPIPGEAKLGWWQEELVGWTRGARRHPLGTALQRQPAPWTTLAAALPSLGNSRERPGDPAESFAALAPFARAVADIEQVLFAGTSDAAAPPAPAAPVDGAARRSGTDVVAATLLQARLLIAGDAGVPLDVIARAGEADSRPLWMARLRQQWPGADGTRPRRLWAALARGRLAGGDATTPLPGWRALFAGWRAARG